MRGVHPDTGQELDAPLPRHRPQQRDLKVVRPAADREGEGAELQGETAKAVLLRPCSPGRSPSPDAPSQATTCHDGARRRFNW